jgi:nitrate/nitrite transporter NarK
MDEPSSVSAKVILLEETNRSSDADSSTPAAKPEKDSLMSLRLFILFGICCLTFGSYWVFDTPGAIPRKLKDWFAEDGKKLTDSQILLFYSIYSWPNTVLALFGGVIVDKFTGLRLGALMFCFFILSGQLVSRHIGYYYYHIFPIIYPVIN